MCEWDEIRVMSVFIAFFPSHTVYFFQFYGEHSRWLCACCGVYVYSP